MNLITTKELHLAIIKSFGKGGFAKLLLQVSQVKKINRFYEQHKNDTADEFIDAVIKRLNLKFEINDEDLKRIPATGAFITVSNHPFGGIDGILLLKILATVRPDYKIMSSYLLQRIKPIEEFLLPVNTFDLPDNKNRSFSDLKNAFYHLSEGHPLGIFPAGRVSTYNPDTKQIADAEWQYPILKFIKKTNLPVVPVNFFGRNRSNVYLMSVIHPMLKSSQLPQELFNRKNRVISIRIGKPIQVTDLDHFSNISQFGRFLRIKTYALGSSIDVKKFYRYQFKQQDVPEKIIEPIPKEKLIEDILKIPKEHFLFKVNNYCVYCVPSFEIPNILNEIGRLREITFRQIGEGTNKSIDIDEFDLYYLHLFIWDDTENQIVGAYRVGKGLDIINQFGKKGFYLHSLFKIDDKMLPLLSESLELGRSFICKEYQQKPVPLFLLWKGILYFLLKHKEYRYLIGPVSISNKFSKISKALITEFIKSNYFNHDLSQLIIPRTQFTANFPEVDTDIILQTTHHDINKFDKLIEEIEPANFKLPVLLKKYIKLNARIIGFNIDPKFNDALDGLIMLDLFNVPLVTIHSLSKELEDTDILERFNNNDPELLKKIPDLSKSL
ncbi:MAG: hemolysin [Bacteroidetes bacterium CG23_combo_of_CG06-09_8_20_14_all_32_9]|nr:MAG: hemolysin [Bacteroidetes bacterium CG23_combo_of_CG06-09_8_20_14_all_32_9]